MSQLDLLNPHPRGWANPLVLRVSAILTDAWDVTPLELVCSGAEWISFNFTYTRAAAFGAFDFQIQTSIYAAPANVPAAAATWATVSLYDAGLMVAGADVGSEIQREFITYEATGAGAEAIIYGPLHLARTIERIRVVARESGVPGNQGVLQISAELY